MAKMACGALVFVLLPFGGAFALSRVLERMLKLNMSSTVRGIFVLGVGYLALQALLVISFISSEQSTRNTNFTGFRGDKDGVTALN